MGEVLLPDGKVACGHGMAGQASDCYQRLLPGNIHGSPCDQVQKRPLSGAIAFSNSTSVLPLSFQTAQLPQADLPERCLVSNPRLA